MPGPAPTPTTLKLVHGNPGKRPLNKREPRPELGRPTCPSWLPREAKAEWGRITSQLEAMKLLHKIDRGLITAWSVCWAQMHDATVQIDAEGYVTETEKGNLIQHPMVGVRNRAITQMLHLAQQFGLSPSARTRIQVGNQEAAQTPLQEIIARGKASRG